MTISADETGYEAVSISINGVDVTTSGFDDKGNTTYTVDYVVASTDTARAEEDQIPISVILTDIVGNTNTAFTTSPDANVSPGIDTNAPTLSTVSISSDNSNTTFAKPGDTVTLILEQVTRRE